MLSAEEMEEIKQKVRKEFPLPEKACPTTLSKVFARREFAKRQYIKQKEKEKKETGHQKKKVYENVRNQKH